MTEQTPQTKQRRTNKEEPQPLRKHTYSNILKISSLKTESFQIKKSDIFHISAENIDCGYSGSNEYQQSMF